MAAGEDVSHGVGLACDVRDLMMVTIVAVVQAGQTAEVGSGLVRGDGTFAILGGGSNIVIEGGERELLKVKEA